MRRLKPSQKQIDFASSLGIDVTGLNARQLRHEIDKKLDEQSQENTAWRWARSHFQHLKMDMQVFFACSIITNQEGKK